MAIVYQPATAPESVPTRVGLPLSPHALVAAELSTRGWTAARLAALIVITALGIALATAIVAGTALFTLLNIA